MSRGYRIERFFIIKVKGLENGRFGGCRKFLGEDVDGKLRDFIEGFYFIFFMK